MLYFLFVSPFLDSLQAQLTTTHVHEFHKHGSLQTQISTLFHGSVVTSYSLFNPYPPPYTSLLPYESSLDVDYSIDQHTAHQLRQAHRETKGVI
jgi:hypothetical protein